MGKAPALNAKDQARLWVIPVKALLWYSQGVIGPFIPRASGKASIVADQKKWGSCEYDSSAVLRRRGHYVPSPNLTPGIVDTNFGSFCWPGYMVVVLPHAGNLVLPYRY